jgi:hypothetical protein
MLSTSYSLLGTTDAVGSGEKWEVMPEVDQEIMTRLEVSQTWPWLKYETLKYYSQIGKGPRSFKAGSRRLYMRRDVEAWIAEQYQTSVTS